MERYSSFNSECICIYSRLYDVHRFLISKCIPYTLAIVMVAEMVSFSRIYFSRILNSNPSSVSQLRGGLGENANELQYFYQNTPV